MGSRATKHFMNKGGKDGLDVAEQLNLLGAVAVDIKNSKTKNKMAKLDDKLGVESKYKEYKDITNLMKEKRNSAEETLLKFKKYVN